MTINFRFFSNLQAVILVLIIAIIVIVLFFAYINANSTANDQKRLADIEQIQAALKIYFNENGFYPATSNGIPKDIESYLSFWPQAPASNGNCTEQQNTYLYSVRPGMDYWVNFCLGEKHENLAAGVRRASSKGIE